MIVKAQDLRAGMKVELGTITAVRNLEVQGDQFLECDVEDAEGKLRTIQVGPDLLAAGYEVEVE